MALSSDSIGNETMFEHCVRRAVFMVPCEQCLPHSCLPHLNVAMHKRVGAPRRANM
jgi:hypothetical protein